MNTLEIFLNLNSPVTQEDAAWNLINNNLLDDISYPLYQACREGFLDVVKTVIKRGVDIDRRDYRGIIPKLKTFGFQLSR